VELEKSYPGEGVQTETPPAKKTRKRNEEK
jgi:hypothetical protein